MKIIVIGNTCSGKTQFLRLVTGLSYDPATGGTIGVDYFIRVIGSHKLRSWDTTGPKAFHHIVHSYYRDCDVFVAPSRYESFGLILLEAMRYGKACVGSAIGGMQEVIRDGHDGILVTPGDSADLYNKISSLVRNVELRRHLGSAARQSFVEKFTESTMCRAALEMYRSISAKNRPA